MIQSILSQHVYLGKYSILTEEFVEMADQVYDEWKDSQKKLSTAELMEIFPEARKVYAKHIQESIRLCKEKQENILDLQRKANNIIGKAPFTDQWFWSIVADVLLCVPSLSTLEREIKRKSFLLASLKTEKPTPGKITEADISNAKQVPIENFYSDHTRKQGHRLYGKCPFHTETQPSFVIYEDQNSFYCYSCNAGGDVIAFVMKQRDIGFLDAVKFLINK